MQIKEARGIYQSQIKSYSKTASELRQKQKELEEKIKETPNGKVVYENEAVSLELSLNAIEQKQNEYRDYMENAKNTIPSGRTKRTKRRRIRMKWQILQRHRWGHRIPCRRK